MHLKANSLVVVRLVEQRVVFYAAAIRLHSCLDVPPALLHDTQVVVRWGGLEFRSEGLGFNVPPALLHDTSRDV